MSLSLSFGFVLKKFSITLTNTWSLLPPLFWWLDPSSVSLRTSLTIWRWNLFPVSLYQFSCTWTFHDLEFCHEIVYVCVCVSWRWGRRRGRWILQHMYVYFHFQFKFVCFASQGDVPVDEFGLPQIPQSAKWSSSHLCCILSPVHKLHLFVHWIVRGLCFLLSFFLSILSEN